MTAHLFTGWAFPPEAILPIARSLGCPIVPDPAEAACWIGWSLGGLRALELASRTAPPTQLVLLASTALFCAEHDWPGLPPANLRALRRRLDRDPDAALRGFHALCAPDADAALIDRRCAESREMPTESLRAGLRDLATLDMRAILPAIRTPVLLLHGAFDRVIPVETAHAMAAKLPNARLRIHPEAGHDLPLAHRDWVIEQLRHFLHTPA